jgi:hypothetical protein
VVRLVVGELESSELKLGERLGLRLAALPDEAESGGYPSGMDRPRPAAERVEWLLASMYCPCGVAKDVCTGHFYTLASCNPNGCAMPKHMRSVLAQKIEQGLSDRRIFDDLVKEYGPLLLRQHLEP